MRCPSSDILIGRRCFLRGLATYRIVVACQDDLREFWKFWEGIVLTNQACEKAPLVVRYNGVCFSHDEFLGFSLRKPEPRT